jgi:BirA family biotin operon repressor/biotin-[acetyl-CoA-carboxylase] ligase
MRDQILQSLIESGNDYLSGESLSHALGVSRAAVWKHVSALRSIGYAIESVPHKGYRLLQRADVLSYVEISSFLATDVFGKLIVHYDTISSTNDEAKKLAEQGAKHGTVVISEEQTLGKGRLGSQWPSPLGTGIWLSVILRPASLHPKHAEAMTQALATALVNALAPFDIKATVYHPNDILIDGQKISGILTEMSAELSQINYLILGIGIHLTGLTSIEAVTGKKIDRKKLTAALLNNFEHLYNQTLSRI